MSLSIMASSPFILPANDIIAVFIMTEENSVTYACMYRSVCSCYIYYFTYLLVDIYADSIIQILVIMKRTTINMDLQVFVKG